MSNKLVHFHESDKIIAGNTIPIVGGLAVMCAGALGMLSGGVGLPGQETDVGQTRTAMSLVGGMFLLLTGLWFMTRSRPTPARVIGFGWMVAAVVLGTYFGKTIASSYGEGHIETANAANAANAANVVFISGLVVHLLGVLYVALAKE